MSTPAVSNVVLVTVDSLRADAIAPYNADRHTPVLRDLADDAAVFERAFATGNWTPFSFPSIMASRPVFADDGQIGVKSAPTLARTLSDAGLTTAGFNAANGFLTGHWGYDDGFDQFEPFVADVSSSMYSQYLAKHPTVEAWVQLAAAPLRRLKALVSGRSNGRPFLDTSRMFDVESAAIDMIETTDEPFFLWVHYMDPHTPYAPAPRYIREVSTDVLGTHRMLHAHARTGLGWEVNDGTLADLRTLYQAAVRQVDASIGRLRSTLKATGQADETALIIAGDHGEEFQEHGHLAHYPKLYDELIHVPLIVDVPGKPARQIEQQVGLDAIPPTVVDLLDVSPPATWEGESLAPSVRAGTPPASDPVVSITVRGEEVTTQPIPRSLADGDLLVSVREGDWTYIEHCGDDHVELYHRPTDPEQTTNRAEDPTADEQAIVDRCHEIVVAHADRLGASDASGVTDDDIEARLAALGYR